MDSFRTAALRWIFPLTAREAAVDFFGIGAVNFFGAEDFDDDLTELFFDFDDALFAEDDRDEDEWPFWATETMGRSRRAVIRSKQVRMRMAADY